MPSTVYEAFTTGGATGGATPTSCDTACVTNFRSRLTTLQNTKQIQDGTIDTSQQLLPNINTVLERLFTGGASAANHASDAQQATSSLRELSTRLLEYKTTVVDPLNSLLSEVSSRLNVNARTTALSQLLQQSASAESQLLAATEDLSTAHTREAVIDTKDDAISYTQAWGYIARPLKRNTIPILIVFTLLFFGIGIAGLWFVSPYAAAAQSIAAGEVGFFQHPAVWMTGVILVVVGLILGALKLGRQI